MSTRYVNLGEVAEFIRGITFKPQDVGPVGAPGSVACMRTSNVQSELDLSDVWGVSSLLVKRDNQYLRRGDILVSSANSWNLVGKCCWVPELPRRATFGGFVSVLRADPHEVDPRFLFRWFASTRIQTIVRSFGQKTTSISNLNLDRCLKLPFPLLPLPEQERIAEGLDRVDSLRAKRRAALAQLDLLTQSIFLDMFGEPTTNPKGWPSSALGNVTATTSGGTPDRMVLEYFGGGIPWVKSGELHQRIVTATEETLTQRGLKESSAKLMPPGTVLVAMYGATVGTSAILGVEAATNQAICCILPTQELLADYLVHLLERLAPTLLAKRVGGAQPNLSQQLIRQLVIPLPPCDLQQVFVSRVREVDRVRVTHCLSLTSFDALFSSIQALAFMGEV